MNNRILIATAFLASSILCSAAEDDISNTRFADEGMLLRHLNLYNATKRVSVLHKSERYHIYTGGRGSGIRIYNGFIFREVDKIFTLIAHITPEPLSNGGVRPIQYLIPEIDATGVTFLARKAEPRIDREFEVVRISFDDLRRIPKEGIQYLPSPYKSMKE